MSTGTRTASRRAFLKGGALVASSAAVFPILEGCGTSAGTTAAQSGPPKTATIDVAWWGAALRDQLTEKVMKEFEQQHPGWHTTPTFSNFSDYFNEMNVKAAASSLPDVIQLGGSYVPQYAGEGQLLDLNPYLGGKPLDISGFDQGQLNQGTVSGKLYAITLGGNMPAMIYNATLLEKAGMSPPPDNVSWSQFAAYCKQLQAKLPSGVYALDDNSGTGGPGMEVWIRQLQAGQYTSAGQLAYGAATVESWLQWWAQLRNAKAVVPGTVEAAAIQNGSNQGTPLVLGKAVFTLIWSNYLTQYAPLMNASLGMTRYPTGGKQAGDFIQMSQSFSVSAHSRYPYVAAAFINLCVNDPTAIKTLGVERGIPAAARTQKILESSSTLTPTDRAEVAFMNKYGPLTRPLTALDPAKSGALTMLIENAAQSVALGTASVSQAAATYISAAQRALT